VDPLGGLDLYSASKAAAELVAASFFTGAAGHPARVATVRAGNVIGGGDWATDRLVPDCVRAFMRQAPVVLRFPHAVRPWQHVLEPLAGYLQLAEHLLASSDESLARAWNFGPAASGDTTAGELAATLARVWGAGARVESAPSADHPHEAGLLRLDSTLARTVLDWQPRWSLAQTVAWYQAWLRGADMTAFSFAQIHAYETTDPTR